MKIAYKPVVIMYNPTSTGPSKANAEALAREIEQKTTNSVIKLTPTKYPGHAEKLAAHAMKNYTSPLIISSSGDGAYHEMVNGLMATKKHNPKAVAGVLPSGNANDHHRAVHEHPLIDSILSNITQTIGLLELNATINKKVVLHRYAHSYIGLGVSSAVAKSLNRSNKTPIGEKWASIKTFLVFKPFKIEHEGEIMKLDSLLFSNIDEMAKNLTIAKNIKPDQKTFGLNIHRHQSRWHLLSFFTRAATTGVASQTRLKTYSFCLLKNTTLQMDGEVYSLKAGTDITVTKISDALRVLG